jgi:hypothetical protein
MAETPDGWLMVDFVSRQAAATTYERVRKARERKLASQEDVTKRYTNSDEDVTNEKEAVVEAVTFPSTSASAAVSFSDSFDSISDSDSFSRSESGSARVPSQKKTRSRVKLP